MTQDSNTTTIPEPFIKTLADRDRWLTKQIRQLSVDVLAKGTFTCTECGEVAGDYIITQNGEELRLSTAEAYAFLQFMLQAA